MSDYSKALWIPTGNFFQTQGRNLFDLTCHGWRLYAKNCHFFKVLRVQPSRLKSYIVDKMYVVQAIGEKTAMANGL